MGPFGDLKTAIGSKKALESAIGSRRSTKNEARDGYIGNLRHHKAFESAKYSKTNGKTMKNDASGIPPHGARGGQGGVRGGSGRSQAASVSRARPLGEALFKEKKYNNDHGQDLTCQWPKSWRIAF